MDLAINFKELLCVDHMHCFHTGWCYAWPSTNLITDNCKLNDKLRPASGSTKLGQLYHITCYQTNCEPTPLTNLNQRPRTVLHMCNCGKTIFCAMSHLESLLDLTCDLVLQCRRTDSVQTWEVLLNTIPCTCNISSHVLLLLLLIHFIIWIRFRLQRNIFFLNWFFL